MIVAGIASLPERHEALVDTVNSLLPQVDRVVVYLAPGHEFQGDHEKVEVHRVVDAHLDMGDAGKFWGINAPFGFGKDGYYFACDDDLIYPPDYVDTMVAGIEKYNREAVVGLHGVKLAPRIRHYYRDRKVFHGLGHVPTDVRVHVLGTCSMAFHSSTLRWLSFEDFETPNIADIWVAVFAQQRQIPMVALAHKAGWVTHSQKVAMDRTLFNKFHRDSNYPGNEVLKRVKRWKLYPLPSPAIP